MLAKIPASMDTSPYEKRNCTIWQKLRKIGMKKKLSQGDVARILTVYRIYIGDLERGVRNQSFLIIQKIAKAFGILPKESL